MAWKCALILICWLFASKLTQAQLEQQVTYPSSLLDRFNLISPASGEWTAIQTNGDAKPMLLFVFLSPECPLSQQYSLQLNELAKHYQKQLSVIGIFPGKSYKGKTIMEFVNKYKLSFRSYIDESKALSNHFQATVTPEVILMTNEKDMLSIEYRGAIDDRVKDLGVKQLKASSYYLRDAIEQWLQQKNVVIKRTNPVGCLINDY